MEKCMDCNSTLKRGETECWACGSAVIVADGGSKLSGGFASLINFFLYLAGIMTVVSLFWDATPPFSRCVVATLVLFLAKSSMGQMAYKKKD
jgi:hypothetical protein